MRPSCVTAEWLMRFEDNMRFLANETATNVAENVWWDEVAKLVPSEAAEEHFAWFLKTAVLEDAGNGGNVTFRPMTMQETSFKNAYSNAGLELDRAQLLDLKNGVYGGEAIAAASEWVPQIVEQFAYWPQRKIAGLMVCGAASGNHAYDGLPFFSGSHLINPKQASLGTFSNLLTGAASGSFPGACPIDVSVSAEVALQNLGNVLAYIAGIKDQTGTMPRYLKPKKIVVPSKLMPRAVQITDAKFLAQAATGGAGSADVSAIIRRLGMSVPIEAPELGAGYSYPDFGGNTVTGSDTDYYIVCAQAETTRLGGLVYVEREKHGIQYFTGDGGGDVTDAVLARLQKYQWLAQGRNSHGYGHYDTIFKVKAS